MPKSPKPKRIEKSIEGINSAKKKGAKQKFSGSLKSKAEKEGKQNIIIEDEKWECSLVLLVPQTDSVYNYLLQILVDLSENFTVLTKDAIADTKDNKSQIRSRKVSKTRTSIRSTSKNSKQSSKGIKSKKNYRKEVIQEIVHLVESSSDEINSFKDCLALKKLIIGLRNTDIANFSKKITESKTDELENKIKNQDKKTRGSGGGVDSQKTVTEENITNNENVLHRFVILLGFYDPLLPEVLNKQNVSIKAIVNVTDNSTDTHSKERTSTVTGTAKSKRKQSGKSTKGSAIGKSSHNYSLFLEKMLAFSSNTEFLEKCKDILFLNYAIANLSTKSKEVGLKNKSDMMRICYKIKEAWNKYKLYIETIHVQSIPTANESLNLDDAKIYSTLISMVPLECTSMALILHCIVEQVSWWNGDGHVSEETSNSLLNENSNDRSSNSASKSFSKNITPTLIHHRDEIKCNTFHLDLLEFNFEQITTNVLLKSPVFKLWDRYPSPPEPVRKCFQFHLQKLQNSCNNCTLNLNSLFPKYLHYFLMNVLILKTNQLMNSNYGTISPEPEMKEVHEILLSGKEEEVNDSNSNLFIKEIIYNILCKVPNYSLCQNYAEIFEFVPNVSVETTESSLTQPVYVNRVRNKSSKDVQGETLLQKRELYKLERLDKLVSFLNCSEFVSLYEDFSQLSFCENHRLAKYGFIEILNTQSLCQCLHQASVAFSNINYDYFPVTDSILLWFNNSNQDKELLSYSSTVVLETRLGFRDFYCKKLRESTDCADVSKEEVSNRKSFEAGDESTVDELIPGLVSLTDHHSKSEVNENHNKVQVSNPIIVYNLGSLWLQSTESFNNYFSVDSSSVVVKRVTYFNKKTHFEVNVNKNNTSLRYQLDPESSNHFVQLFIDVHETLNVNCVLNWDINPEEPSLQRNSKEFSENFETVKDKTISKLNCNLSITLTSGLFIEVVPTNGSFGPFYVRQRYLGKGPNCSSIWEETYRCYFNNGMVLIFRVDGCIDIIYSNGTTVKCKSFELTKFGDLSDTKGDKIDPNIRENVNADNLIKEETHRTKESKNKQQNKGKSKANPKKSRSEGFDGKETNKQSKKVKKKEKKEPKISVENKEETLLMEETVDEKHSYEVIEHSVLSWSGECSQYNSGNYTEMRKSLSLRAAFDMINQELYWQRSDGMSALQCPGKLIIRFPDGNKTTSFTLDNKELRVENDYAIIYRITGDLVKVESFNVPYSTSGIGIESREGKGDANHKVSLLAADTSSKDSFGTESIEEKGFVYVENSFLMEHTNYASVEFLNEECELKLALPGNCWIIVDEGGKFSFKGSKNERVSLFDDTLLFEANVLNSSNLSKSSTTLRFENVCTVPIIFNQTEDSFGNFFSVDERGNTNYLQSMSCKNYNHPGSSSYCARFPQNTERLFVLHRDLTGYEMIHEVEQANTLSNEDVSTVTTPVVRDELELQSVYMQSPIYRTKCEEYIMHDVDEITPTLIKRKDLLQTHQTPETIWFTPDISSVKKLTEKNTATQSDKRPKAMMIAQRLKIKKTGLDVVSLIYKSLTKYMESNEQIYQKYLNCHPKETLKEEDLVECEKNRMSFLGSKSYFLTDNLPVVITGEMAKGNEPTKDIFSIFSCSVSKVSL